MGKKGDKHTSAAAETAALWEAKLDPIGGITTKKMFGGYGIFHEGKMFGMVNSKGEAFLKTNEEIQAKFEAAGSQRHAKMPYYTLPESVVINHEEWVEWAKESIRISKK